MQRPELPCADQEVVFGRRSKLVARRKENTSLSIAILCLVVISAFAYFLSSYGIKNHLMFLLSSAKKVLAQTR